MRIWAIIAMTVIAFAFTAMTYRITRRMRRARRAMRRLAYHRLLATAYELDDEHHHVWGIGG